MKRIFALLFILLPMGVFAQDLIFKKNGDEIRAKVLKADGDVVTYKAHDNQDGPTLTIRKQELMLIRYADGRREMLSDPSRGSVGAYVPDDTRGALSTESYGRNFQGMYHPYQVGLKFLGALPSGNYQNEIYNGLKDRAAFGVQLDFSAEINYGLGFKSVLGINNAWGKTTEKGVLLNPRTYDQVLQHGYLMVGPQWAIPFAGSMEMQLYGLMGPVMTTYTESIDATNSLTTPGYMFGLDFRIPANNKVSFTPGLNYMALFDSGKNYSMNVWNVSLGFSINFTR